MPQNLTPHGQFIGESKEGLAFANRDFGGEWRSIAANAKPPTISTLQIFSFSLSCCSASSKNKNLVDANMPDKEREMIESDQ